MDTGQEPSGIPVTPPEKVEVAVNAIINNVVGLIYRRNDLSHTPTLPV
jgi:hypothetical protein